MVEAKAKMVKANVVKAMANNKMEGSCGPAQAPPRCTACNSPPINGQCTNFILFDVALPLNSKRLSSQMFHLHRERLEEDLNAATESAISTS